MVICGRSYHGYPLVNGRHARYMELALVGTALEIASGPVQAAYSTTLKLQPGLGWVLVFWTELLPLQRITFALPRDCVYT